ncbi:hypothetical protein [Natranaerobius trueperi]|nr:hypothetical protein [Natranaerobius trueperi]
MSKIKSLLSNLLSSGKKEGCCGVRIESDESQQVNNDEKEEAENQ